MWYTFAEKHFHRKIRRFTDEGGEGLESNNILLGDDGVSEDDTIPEPIKKRTFNPWNEGFQPIIRKRKPVEEVGGQDAPLPGVINAPGEPREDKPIVPPVLPEMPPKPKPIDAPDQSDTPTIEQPQNPTGLVPPVHDQCHCSIETLPGGRQVWKTSNSACDDCKRLRAKFNSTQDMLFPLSKKTEIETMPMRAMLK